MTSWAKVGAKCVCIAEGNDGWEYDNGANAPGPKTGEECTVRGVEGGAIQLVGYHPEDEGYDPQYFRPLITKTQSEDVTMFLELLQKQGEPA